MLMKKGWNIKFNEFVSGQKFLGEKKIGMKAGSKNDDTLLKTMLYTNMQRFVGAVTQRASYALLYINDIYVGVYFMHEEIAPEFIQKRVLGDDGSGNFYKFFWNVNLFFYGNNESYYQNKVHINEIGVGWNYYEQSDGNGDWSDFISLLQWFNITNQEDFDEQIESKFNVTTILRQMAVESFMLASDNLASGQNYYGTLPRYYNLFYSIDNIFYSFVFSCSL